MTKRNDSTTPTDSAFLPGGPPGHDPERCDHCVRGHRDLCARLRRGEEPFTLDAERRWLAARLSLPLDAVQVREDRGEVRATVTASAVERDDAQRAAVEWQRRMPPGVVCSIHLRAPGHVERVEMTMAEAAQRGATPREIDGRGVGVWPAPDEPTPERARFVGPVDTWEVPELAPRTAGRNALQEALDEATEMMTRALLGAHPAPDASLSGSSAYHAATARPLSAADGITRVRVEEPASYDRVRIDGVASLLKWGPPATSEQVATVREAVARWKGGDVVVLPVRGEVKAGDLVALDPVTRETRVAGASAPEPRVGDEWRLPNGGTIEITAFDLARPEWPIAIGPGQYDGRVREERAALHALTMSGALCTRTVAGWGPNVAGEEHPLRSLLELLAVCAQLAALPAADPRRHVDALVAAHPHERTVRPFAAAMRAAVEIGRGGRTPAQIEASAAMLRAFEAGLARGMRRERAEEEGAEAFREVCEHAEGVACLVGWWPREVMRVYGRERGR
jgi:hypothetical protein